MKNLLAFLGLCACGLVAFLAVTDAGLFEDVIDTRAVAVDAAIPAGAAAIDIANTEPAPTLEPEDTFQLVEDEEPLQWGTADRDTPAGEETRIAYLADEIRSWRMSSASLWDVVIEAEMAGATSIVDRHGNRVSIAQAREDHKRILTRILPALEQELLTLTPERETS